MDGPTTDFVLARRLHALAPRPRVAGWDDLVDRLHGAAPHSRAALLVLCDVACVAETRRVDVIGLLAATGGPLAEARLLRYLEDQAPRVVRAAVRALGRVGTHRAAAALAALGPPHAVSARRALVLVRARVGRLEGAVSEAAPTLDGRLAVARRSARGRLSE